MVLGAADTGKSHLARRLALSALAQGLTTAYLDTDIGQSTIGPPTTLGLRIARSRTDLDDGGHDDLYFVGSLSPAQRLASMVAGTVRLLETARARADLLVMDTSGYLAGLVAPMLKIHKLELARPDVVVGLQREGELDGLLAIAERVATAEIIALPVHPAAARTSTAQRAQRRRSQLIRYFFGTEDKPAGDELEGLPRVAAGDAAVLPVLPPDLDPARLEGLLVGVEDGRGRLFGVGLLEVGSQGLQVVAPADSTWSAPGLLRLGAARVEEEWHARSVDLRALLHPHISRPRKGRAR